MSPSSLSKLPPNVLRELRRHISPNPVSKHSMSETISSTTSAAVSVGGYDKGTMINRGMNVNENEHNRQQFWNNNMKYVLGGCIVFTTMTASFPLVAHYYMSGLNEKEEPLTAAQVRRGAFLNSGTKDIGKDPNWDFTNGKYKKDTGYYAMSMEEQQQQNNNNNNSKEDSSTIRPSQQRMPGEYLAMPADDIRKQEDNLRAFAEGRRRQDGREIVRKQ
jgi:hypothetical protein